MGGMHGFFQIVEKALGWQKYKGRNWVVRTIRVCVTFLLVNFAWLFFRMPSIGEAWGILMRMFTNVGVPNLSDMGLSPMIMAFTGLFVLVFKDIRDEFLSNKMHFLETKPVRWVIYVLLFCLVLTFGVDGGQFIYVSF